MLPRMATFGVILTAVLGLGACGGSSDGGSASTADAAAPTGLSGTECGTQNGRGCAPASKRVDLRTPSFSHSTEITNPLFPISELHSALLLGHVDNKPFRTETTLLPGSQTVTWNGREVRVLISQYVAYLDRRLEEVALDRYAQADDGSVWYFGEDVFDYKHGTVALTEGTWLAGREGPAAMIMPGKPKVGDVFRTENAPGIVFEEVTVKAVGKTLAGPVGPIAGGMVGDELHTDGTHEDKLFAPGYGEFRTAGGGDLEALALAVPANALQGPPPVELQSMLRGAEGILESARLRDWEEAAASLRRMNASWKAARAVKQPRMVVARLNGAMAALSRAVGSRKAAPTTQAAIDVGQSVSDLELRYLPPSAVDAERFHLWTQQLRVDAAAKDLAGVTGDVAVLEWIRDRIVQTLDDPGRREIDTRLRDLRAATDARNLPAAADHAARLAARLRNLSPPAATG